MMAAVASLVLGVFSFTLPAHAAAENERAGRRPARRARPRRARAAARSEFPHLLLCFDPDLHPARVLLPAREPVPHGDPGRERRRHPDARPDVRGRVHAARAVLLEAVRHEADALDRHARVGRALRAVRVRQCRRARVHADPRHRAARSLLRLLLRVGPSVHRLEGRPALQERRARLDHARDVRRRHADRLLGRRAAHRRVRSRGGGHDWRSIWLYPAAFAAARGRRCSACCSERSRRLQAGADGARDRPAQDHG